MDGPATVVPQGRAYHVLLAESQDFGYRCPPGTAGPAVTDHGRFAPTATRAAATESAFRDALRRSVLAGPEAMAPDSVATITELYGNVAVPREVGRDELVRLAEREYGRALEWDRQYAGVVDARGDNVLVVNVVSPVLGVREVLADRWVIPPAAAAGYVKTVGFELATGEALPLCGAPAPQPLTSGAAARAGRHERSIMTHTRHKSERVLRAYIREGALFDENPTDDIGL